MIVFDLQSVEDKEASGGEYNCVKERGRHGDERERKGGERKGREEKGGKDFLFVFSPIEKAQVTWIWNWHFLPTLFE